MKTINKLLTLMVVLTLSSCLIDDDVATDSFDQGANIVGFSSSSLSANALADGNEATVDVPLIVTGPTSTSISNDINVTLSIDPSSTAIEGTHFTLDNTALTLAAANGLAGSLPLTIITDGIIPPLAEAPVIVLNIASSDDTNTIISGRTGQVEVTINYLCFSNLAGEYTIAYTSGDLNHDVSTISDGVYEMTSMFAWPTSGYIVSFTDVCGELTLINDWQFSNEIAGIGTVDYDSGNLNWTGVTVEAVYADRNYTMEKVN